jgi:hypothetical protein
MSKRKMSAWLLSGVIVGLLLVGAHGSTAQGQTVLTLSSLDVGVAETGVIEGRVDCGSSGCGGVKITLSFDRSLIRIEEAVVGPALGDQVFLSENTVDNAAGTVQLTAAATVAPPAGADNLLFSLTVYGLKPGTASCAGFVYVGGWRGDCLCDGQDRVLQPAGKRLGGRVCLRA